MKFKHCALRPAFLAYFSVLFIVSCSPKVTAPSVSASDVDTGSELPKAYGPGLNDTTLLWSILPAGASEPSYLFGTIHIIPEEDYFMPNRVLKALNTAEEVVFEIDPRDMQNPGKIMGMVTKLNMKDGTRLSDLLTEEEYATVKSYFEGLGMPFGFFARMKPLFLSAMVGQSGEGGGMPGLGGLGGAEGMKSYEMELSEVAKAAGKEIGGLETMEFQLSLFDSIDYKDQAQMLHQAILSDMDKENDGGDNQLDQLVAMYRRQAVAEMASLMSEESAGVNRFEELLLTKRNQNWAPTIADAATLRPTFYAVGAGHLGGENGVIALLRKRGVTVEPVY